MLKLVPYISFPYAEHALRLNGAAPNDPVAEEHVDQLIASARSCKDLVQSFENCKDGVVQGYIVYSEDPNYKPPAVKEGGEEEKKKMTTGEESEDGDVNVKTDEQTVRFRGKILKEFMPGILLEQFKEQTYMEYESFDNCVDEYFSQADK
jgi:hypothetical protein